MPAGYSPRLKIGGDRVFVGAGREPMRAGVAAALVGVVCLLAGCRTSQPNLEPPKEPERLSTPPNENRYDTSSYPKEAFHNSDLFRRRELEPGQSILPTRGGMTGPGMSPGRAY